MISEWQFVAQMFFHRLVIKPIKRITLKQISNFKIFSSLHFIGMKWDGVILELTQILSLSFYTF